MPVSFKILFVSLNDKLLGDRRNSVSLPSNKGLQAPHPAARPAEHLQAHLVQRPS